MRVVITGSLGHIGEPLTRQLVKEGHLVTVVSSNPDRQAAIEALGATAAIGSVDDVDFLTKAFARSEAVFCLIPPNYAETDQVAYYQRIAHNYAHAVRQTGVKRVVHLSSYGAHLDKGTGFILGAHYAELILNDLSDVAVTHLRAGYFYYNLFGFIDMVKEAGFFGANYGGNDRIPLVAPGDIATVAAQELVSPATGHTVRYVVSDEQTASDIAHALGAAIGTPDLEWKTFTDAQTEAALTQRGMPPHVVSNFVEMGASLHSGALMEDYEIHKPIALGSVKLSDFAQEFAAAF